MQSQYFWWPLQKFQTRYISLLWCGFRSISHMGAYCLELSFFCVNNKNHTCEVCHSRQAVQLLSRQTDSTIFFMVKNWSKIIFGGSVLSVSCTHTRTQKIDVAYYCPSWLVPGWEKIKSHLDAQSRRAAKYALCYDALFKSTISASLPGNINSQIIAFSCWGPRAAQVRRGGR